MAADTRPQTAPGQASRAFLRLTILQALDGLLEVRAWSDITMTDLARAAEVSRQTLYNEFGTRDDIVAAYVLWASDLFLDEVERAVAANRHDLHAALAAAFELILTVASEHALIRGLEATSGTEGMLALASPTTGPIVVATATDRLAGIIGFTWPGLPVDAVHNFAEVLVRLALSHLLMPTATPVDAAALISAVLDPYIASYADELTVHAVDAPPGR